MRHHKNDLTYDFVFSVFNYNPETGVFIRKQRIGKNNRVLKASGRPVSSRGKGRLVVTINGKLYSAHRLAWLLYYGVWPEKDIDHIDCDFTNNRITNLRECTSSQNKMNRRKQPNNTSGYKGVLWSNQNKKWIARVKKEGKLYFFGFHKCPTAAYLAYCQGAKELHGEYARLA